MARTKTEDNVAPKSSSAIVDDARTLAGFLAKVEAIAALMRDKQISELPSNVTSWKKAFENLERWQLGLERSLNLYQKHQSTGEPMPAVAGLDAAQAPVTVGDGSPENPPENPSEPAHNNTKLSKQSSATKGRKQKT